MKIKTLIPAFVIAVGLGAAPVSKAESFGFSQLSNNAGVDISSQFNVDVTDANGEVCFSFSNIGTISSVITQIYFDDAPPGPGNNFGHLGEITMFSGDWRAYDVHPGDLPGGNNANPSFTVDGDTVLFATANNPTPKNGVGLGESLAIYMSYKSGGLSDVIDDLVSGALRIGLHVQSIGTSGESDAYITKGRGTPVPDGGTTMALLGMGLTAIGFLNLRVLRRSKS